VNLQIMYNYLMSTVSSRAHSNAVTEDPWKSITLGHNPGFTRKAQKTQ